MKRDPGDKQMDLFDTGFTSHEGRAVEREVARMALDDLFYNARRYKSSQDYHALVEFIARFRFYSPFNAMLIHVQMPGATFVAPAERWAGSYGRRIKLNARPLVILQPKGPIMFVFDVSDTEPEDEALPLPLEVTAPFETLHGVIANELEWTRQNAARDGIEVATQHAGSQSAGSICEASPGKSLDFQTAIRPKPVWMEIPRRYELLLNGQHSREAQYATLAHELAHLYCGHIGTPNDKWWPDRRKLPKAQREFEAESVCYLVCGRAGIDNPSHRYLAGYVESNKETPAISLDCVLKAAGLLEQMGRGRMKVRPEPDN